MPVILSVVIRHDGSFLRVDGISFFGGDALGGKRYHEKCRYLAIVVGWICAGLTGGQATSLFSFHHIGIEQSHANNNPRKSNTKVLTQAGNKLPRVPSHRD